MTLKVETTGRLYQTDFVAWTEQTANLIRTGQYDKLDWNAILEEIESLGK